MHTEQAAASMDVPGDDITLGLRQVDRPARAIRRVLFMLRHAPAQGIHHQQGVRILLQPGDDIGHTVAAARRQPGRRQQV